VVLQAWITSPCLDPRMAIPTATKVNPLQTTWLEHGTVSGRVALLLRSAEIQPLFRRFVRMDFSIHPCGQAAPGSLFCCCMHAGFAQVLGSSRGVGSLHLFFQPVCMNSHKCCKQKSGAVLAQMSVGGSGRAQLSLRGSGRWKTCCVFCRICRAKEGRIRGVGVDPKEECMWKEEGSLRQFGVSE
jgi:hypothetical protein